MPAQLIALIDGSNILIDKPILLFGRHPECDIQIDSRKVSRRHCCLAQVNDYLVVRDLDSTNGIRINGVRVIEGRLNDGDELMIGDLRYRVSEIASGPMPYERAVPAVGRSGLADPDDQVLDDADVPVALPETARPQVGAANPMNPYVPTAHDAIRKRAN